MDLVPLAREQSVDGAIILVWMTRWAGWVVCRDCAMASVSPSRDHRHIHYRYLAQLRKSQHDLHGTLY